MGSEMCIRDSECGLDAFPFIERLPELFGITPVQGSYFSFLLNVLIEERKGAVGILVVPNAYRQDCQSFLNAADHRVLFLEHLHRRIPVPVAGLQRPFGPPEVDVTAVTPPDLVNRQVEHFLWNGDGEWRLLGTAHFNGSVVDV